MRLTVTELPADQAHLPAAWEALIAHLTIHGSDLLLLPEMPFAPWLAATRDVDPRAWDDAVSAHEAWLGRFPELGVETIVGSRPITTEAGRRNEAFVWTAADGYRGAHHKYYLPDEDGFWEASWYDRGEKDFVGQETPAGVVGALVCTEVWFTEHARAYGQAGVDILVNPRATEWASREKWLAGGRAAAVMGGAFCLSSNRSGEAHGIRWAGYGWVVDPDGEVLRTTSEDTPFVTVEVDLESARAAKSTYPRYVAD